MPIDFPLTPTRLSTDEMRDLDYQVMAHAFNTHHYLGRLCDEKIYQADLASRLEGAGFRIRKEFPAQISFRDFFADYSMDLIVEDQIIYELKTCSAFTSAHASQLLNYLFLCDFNRGKLINFRPKSVESKFINSTLTTEDRRNFEIHSTNWSGEENFMNLIMELLADWGTSLEVSLYRNAVTHLLGGEAVIHQSIPLFRNEIPPGLQTFSLNSPDTAFTITSVTKNLEGYTSNLLRLLQISKLKRFLWVNIILGRVEFRMISI